MTSGAIYPSRGSGLHTGRGLRACAMTYLLALFCVCSVHAAEQQDAAASTGWTREARAYEHGEGVQKNIDRAIELYCKAAREGDVDAQFSLGWIYANGRGVARQDTLAAFYFALAAAQGHAHARNMLRFTGTPQEELPACMRPDPEPLKTAQEEPQPEPELAAFTPANVPQKIVLQLVNELAPQYGVLPRLALAVIRAESNFDASARSPKNAQGLMQLIPETSARFNVSKPFDPAQNIRGGLSYLRWLLAYFEGDVALVAAAYNAGEGTVNRYRGVPPYAETRAYVQRIMQFFGRHEHPYDPAVTQSSPELLKIRGATFRSQPAAQPGAAARTLAAK
jgi:soluble lytic murein transglycosylase-like protein